MPTKHFNWLLFITILLIAANLRAPITSVGVALPSIKSTLHLSTNEVSLITILPLLAFAVISFYVAKVSTRFGIEKTLFTSLLILLTGILLRAISDVSWLYIGTLFIGIGIAFGNVLAPSMIKAYFPSRIGIVTGYYTVVMNVFGGLSSYTTALLTTHYSYMVALSLIGVITILTIIIFSFQLRNNLIVSSSVKEKTINVWKSPLAWQITLLMGGQSLIFYTLINWLPEMLLEKGISTNKSGFYLLLLQIAILPFTFIVPIIAAKRASQVSILIMTGILFVLGTLGLICFPAKYIVISIIILGIASGFAFGLVNTLFSLRTESAQTATKLAGMAQSLGYLLAAVGPLLFGVVHDVTHHWSASLFILLIMAFVILFFSSGAGRNQTVEETLQK
ncbi:MAG TPA: MFS transporter [Rummeliibacillus sp.]|nr:MFS transporter [Rummeliibacillus sp.]